MVGRWYSIVPRLRRRRPADKVTDAVGHSSDWCKCAGAPLLGFPFCLSCLLLSKLGGSSKRISYYLQPVEAWRHGGLETWMIAMHAIAVVMCVCVCMCVCLCMCVCVSIVIRPRAEAMPFPLGRRANVRKETYCGHIDSMGMSSGGISLSYHYACHRNHSYHHCNHQLHYYKVCYRCSCYILFVWSPRSTSDGSRATTRIRIDANADHGAHQNQTVAGLSVFTR